MTQQEKSIRIHGLMKIGQEEHINQLQKEGKIYCNTVKYFRDLENEDKNRGDGREGAFKTELLDPDSLELSVDGEKIPITFTYARLNQFDNNRNEFKLFCLYGFKNKHLTGEPFVDKRNVDFGDKALIVTDTEELIFRIGSIEDISLTIEAHKLPKLELNSR